jgi:Flp pilus assembly secretin CpaC
VILVTAELVEPQSVPIGQLPYPGMSFNPPNDWEFFLLGKIEGRPPRVSPMQSEQMTELGLDKLRGPGAWASY